MSTISTLQFDDTAEVRRSADQITARIDDQVVTMNITQGAYVGFDPIGSAVWDHLEKPLKFQELWQALARDFDGDSLTIREDLVAFLRKLEELELITIDHSPK